MISPTPQERITFSSWQDPRSWDVNAKDVGVVITCATNADAKRAEKLFNELLARAEKAEQALSERGEKNTALRNKVAKFADLKDNWDSYGARAFPQRTILLAMELAETLGPEWSTVPCADGPSVWLTRDDENDIIEVKSSYEE